MKTISLHSRLLLACMIPTAVLMLLFSIFVILFRFQDIDNLKQETAQILLGKYSLALSRASLSQWQTLSSESLNEKYIRSSISFCGVRWFLTTSQKRCVAREIDLERKREYRSAF